MRAAASNCGTPIDDMTPMENTQVMAGATEYQKTGCPVIETLEINGHVNIP